MSTGMGRAVPLAIPLVLGLWLLGGVAFVGVELALLRVAFGPGAEATLTEKSREVWADRLRAPAPSLAALLPALGLFVLLSVLWARLVVTEAHHPTWIALTIVTGQIVLGLGAALLWQSLRRQLMARRRMSLPSGRAILGGVALVAVGGGCAALVVFWDELLLVGAQALFGPFVVIGVAHTLLSWPRFKLRLRPRGLVLLAMIGLVATVLGEQSPRARLMLANASTTAPHLRQVLGATADLDGDGSAAYQERLGDRGPPDPLTAALPDLILITVDALRADRLGLMGYERATSPELDAQAERGIIFERAYSQNSGTAPSLWSMMTGQTPFQVELRDAHRFPPTIAPEEILLAEALGRAGYRTEAYLCGALFKPGRWDMERGFDHYEEVCAGLSARQGEVVRDPVLEAMRRVEGDAPLFVWAHFYDPHHPYFDHPQIAFGPSPSDHYDEEIRYVQRYVAEVVEAARAAERARPTFVFMSADHGEAFGEHGSATHARTLYREVTHVPLLAWGPGIEPRRETSPVATADLYPTLLDLAHVPTPAASTMLSLVPALRGEPGDALRAVFQENSWSRPRRHVKAVIRGRHHLIRDLSRRTSQLYDLLSDPREQHDLFGEGLPEEGHLGALLDEFIPTTRIPSELR